MHPYIHTYLLLHACVRFEGLGLARLWVFGSVILLLGWESLLLLWATTCKYALKDGEGIASSLSWTRV